MNNKFCKKIIASAMVIMLGAYTLPIYAFANADNIDWETGEGHSTFAIWYPVLYDLDSCYGAPEISVQQDGSVLSLANYYVFLYKLKRISGNIRKISLYSSSAKGLKSQVSASCKHVHYYGLVREIRQYNAEYGLLHLIAGGPYGVVRRRF